MKTLPSKFCNDVTHRHFVWTILEQLLDGNGRNRRMVCYFFLRLIRHDFTDWKMSRFICFGVWAGLFPREGNKIPLSPSLPLPYRTAAGRVKEFLHALARADGGGASTGTPPGVPGATRR